MSLSGQDRALEAWEWLFDHKDLSLERGHPPGADDGDPVEWLVWRVSGNVNDREWDLIGRSSASPLAAVLDAKGAREEASGAGEPVAWPISVDGPHKITDQRAWLARQLMDSKNSDEEAFGIVAYHPAIRDAPPANDRTKALEEALREAQGVLAMMVEPGAIQQTTVINAYAAAKAAEAKARAALNQGKV